MTAFLQHLHVYEQQSYFRDTTGIRIGAEVGLKEGGGGVFSRLSVSALWHVNRNINGATDEQFKFSECAQRGAGHKRRKRAHWNTWKTGHASTFLYLFSCCSQLQLSYTRQVYFWRTTWILTWQQNVPPLHLWFWWGRSAAPESPQTEPCRQPGSALGPSLG